MVQQSTTNRASTVLANESKLMPELEALYKDIHSHPEAKAAGKVNDLPVNHSPKFAPVLHPTLETGVEALVVGALAWLAMA